MTTTLVTLEGNVSDALGVDFNAASTRVYVRYNTEIVTTDDGHRLGSGKVTPEANGDFTLTDVVAATSLVENLQATVVIDYVDREVRAHKYATLGPYDLSAETGTVNTVDLEAVQALDATYLSQAMSDLQDLIDNAAAIATYTLPAWEPSTAVEAGDLYLSPSEEVIRRISDGTTRGSYDATEEALWTVISSGGGGATDFEGTADETFLTTKVTGDTVPRWTVLADGSMLWGDGDDDTAPRRAGMFLERRELFDFGVGEPFSQGHYDFLVVGDVDDPLGDDFETGGFGEDEEHGYNFKVHGFMQVNNSMSVFSRYQPYVVVGRWGIDTRFPTERPEGYGEEVALGVARADTDYFTDIEVGDAAIRVYGDGPGSSGRMRRLLLGSNSGNQSTYADSTISIGGDDATLHRPLNFDYAAHTDDDGYVYVKVAGRRRRARLYDVATQIADTFTGTNGHGLVAADTGDLYYLAAGTWQVQSGKAYPLTKPGTFALALVTKDNDQTIEADITPGTLHSAWLAIRVTDGTASNMLIGVVDSSSGAVRIEKKVGGAYTTLASGTTAAWPTDTTHRLGVEAAGNVITLTVDGATVLTHTLTGGDIATFATAPNCGLLAFDLTTGFDNLTVTSGTDETPDAGGSGVLAVTSYTGGSDVATTSSSAADIDATNLAVTFTVPASGEVIVTLSGWHSAGGSTTYNWLLREGSSTVSGSDTAVAYNGTQGLQTAVIHVTGLTPGDVKTWKWGHRLSFGSNSSSTQTSTGYKPTMTVAAVA